MNRFKSRGLWSIPAATLVLMAAALIWSATATAKGPPLKMEICHTEANRTLSLPPQAALNHLEHGDYLGACLPDDPGGGFGPLL